MGGGLMQLVAYGAQDIYLTGNPQITFFKVVYRRHTNFSMESIEQTFNGAADWGRKVTCTISRNGDLIYRIYLQVTLPRVSPGEIPAGTANAVLFRWLNWIGHVLIKQVEIEIGGQRIDRHYGEWLHIWNELTQESGKAQGYASMVGNVPRLTQVVRGTAAGAIDQQTLVEDNREGVTPEVTLYIPLQFWFCRNPGLALPLIALQYHEVKINLEFREARDVYWSSNPAFNIPSIRAASLYVDYIYLDTDERRRFAQVSHEYLIEQLQFTGDESVNSASNKIKLNFNHPVKELIWVVHRDAHLVQPATAQEGSDYWFGKQWFNFSDAFDITSLSGTPGDALGAGLAGDEQGEYAENLQAILGGLGVFGTAGPPSTAGQAPAVGSATAAPGAPMGTNTAPGTGVAPNVAQLVAGSGRARLLDWGQNPVASAKLQLNGHDRFSERDGRYFNLVQPYQHHSNTPAVGINVYSFGLKPEEHQPSGTCNFSRIDNATLHLTLTAQTVFNNQAARIRVYATNYNVLRIMSGMGGLAYSD